MKQQTKSKALIILNIILLLALFTIPVYAYWASALNKPLEKTDGTEIIIGEAEAVDTIITLTNLQNQYGNLVPAGRKVDDQVEEITFNLVFTWEEEAGKNFTEGTNRFGTLTLKSEVSGTGLLNVEFKPPVTIQLGSRYTVPVTITLTEPATQVEYNTLQAAIIKLTFTFNVDPN